MDKRFLGILAVLVIIFVGFFAFSQKSSKNTAGNTSLTTNHVMGASSPTVTLVEYGDYECSVCYGYYQPIKDALAQVNDKVAFQFINLPLSQIHKNAISSARAAEAAGLQGRYWQMHDLLYENQDPTGGTGWVASGSPLEDYYVKFAQKINLNLAQFRSDFASSKVNDSINADVNAFSKTSQKASVATPTFFLDGKYVDNATFYDNAAGKPTSEKIISYLKDAISKKSQ